MLWPPSARNRFWVAVNVLVKIRACQDITTTTAIFQDTSAAGNYAQLVAQAMLQRVTV
jgi:hypothetical protein